MKLNILTHFCTLILPFMILGCATSREIIGPSGDLNHFISCRNIRFCYEKAHKACKGPYKIVDKTVENAFDGINRLNNSNTSLLIQCEELKSL